MKFADESKSQFCERVMRSHGFEPGIRSNPNRQAIIRKMSRAEMTEESAAIRADMQARHDALFSRTWKYGGPEKWERTG